MGARGFWSLSLVLVAACSSRALAPGADAGEVSDAGPLIVDEGQPDTTGEDCQVTGHAVAWGQPPSECTIPLWQVPPSPLNVRVQVGTTVVPRDDVNGWSYDAGMMAIRLNGTLCQAVLDGTVTGLMFWFGCPTHPHP